MLEKLYNAIATVLKCLQPKKQFTLWAGNPWHIETKTAVVQNPVICLVNITEKLHQVKKILPLPKSTIQKKNKKQLDI